LFTKIRLVDPELLLNIADYARAARAKLPKDVFDYYEGGALDEITLGENSAGWEKLKLYYRVLAGVGPRDMSTTVLGQRISMPIMVAPTAFHQGAFQVLEILRCELDEAMLLCGCTKLTDIDESLLRPGGVNCEPLNR
jgi:isopentenyl diphosphate isomerase/L-lactate dehydrogenase-like FMN-dependent dehydrogenase